MFITIAGNIGLGKSTLAEIIAKEFQFNLKEERVGRNNPHLPPFYEDIMGGVKPSKHAMNLQMFLLDYRVQDHLEIQESDEWWVQDRSIYEDPYIFAAHLNLEGFLSDADYGRYLEAFHEAEKKLKYPELLILLNGSPDLSRERIAKRGRSEEIGLTDPKNLYLENLHSLYSDFLINYGGNSMIISADHDLLNSREEMYRVLKLVKVNTPGMNHDDILIKPVK